MNYLVRPWVWRSRTAQQPVTRRSDCRAKLNTTTSASQQQRERRFWMRVFLPDASLFGSQAWDSTLVSRIGLLADF